MRGQGNTAYRNGLHMHIGSGTDLEHLSKVCGAMEKAAVQIGPSLQSISAGGGLPTVYRSPTIIVDLDAYFAIWDARASDWKKSLAIPCDWKSNPADM